MSPPSTKATNSYLDFVVLGINLLSPSPSDGIHEHEQVRTIRDKSQGSVPWKQVIVINRRIIMGADNNNATDDTSCCASCGIGEVDDINLKECDDCDLVKYCSDECQREHQPEHKEGCKKRAAELRDEQLFKQPESSHIGDCPISCQ